MTHPLSIAFDLLGLCICINSKTKRDIVDVSEYLDVRSGEPEPKSRTNLTNNHLHPSDTRSLKKKK